MSVYVCDCGECPDCNDPIELAADQAWADKCKRELAELLASKP